MRELRVYAGPHGECAISRSGFSFLAAMFFPLWALSKRLYKTSFGVAALSTVGDFLARRHELFASYPAIWFAIALLWFSLLGWFGPRWHRRMLERRGYVLVASTEVPACPVSR